VIVREQVPEGLAGERIDRVLSMLTGRSRAEVAALVEEGSVTIDGIPVSTRSARLRTGQLLEADVPDVDPGAALEADSSIDVPVVYADEHLLVVDKPAGLVVHPGAGRATGTLVQGLLASHPEVAAVGPDRARPGIVHRLDKGTSGLLLVALSAGAYESLVAALAAREVHRRYRALVWGHLGSPRGLVDAPIGRSSREPTLMAVVEGGKEARTRYEVRRTYREPVEVSELTCTLETGRTHQIRVHLRSIGHAVVGDGRYGGARQSLVVGRPFLHAEELDLDHPVTGEPLSFTSPLPDDLQEVLARLAQ